MSMKKNTDYWRHSLKHPEPEEEEEFYIHDEVIVEDEEYLRNVDRLRRLLTTYCVLINIVQRKQDPLYGGWFANASHEHSSTLQIACQTILEQIDDLLKKTPNIRHTEFVAYFKCIGMSFSEYDEMKPSKRLEFLQKILPRYCEKRESVYNRMGYTHVIQQALYDSVVSQKQGASSSQKLRGLLSKLQVSEVSSPHEFVDSADTCFIVISDEKVFTDLKSVLKLKYRYGEERQGKVPDLAIKIGGKILIVEAKHLREAGGHQTEQINQLIDFIRQSEDDESVSYVAFLDGRYFNKFCTKKKLTSKQRKKNKIDMQHESIEKALEEYENNFFVNTAGMEMLLNDLLSKFDNRDAKE